MKCFFCGKEITGKKTRYCGMLCYTAYVKWKGYRRYVMGKEEKVLCEGNFYTEEKFYKKIAKETGIKTKRKQPRRN